MRKNKVWLQRDEFLRESLSRIRVTVCRPASVDPDVVALRPPELLESLPECGDEGPSFPVASACRSAASGQAAAHSPQLAMSPPRRREA